MTDGVPQNTGNAYLIKGASLPDSYAAFKAAIEAGTQGLDLNFNSAGWQVIGSLLSKANLLSDATAAKYFASVAGTETVNQVLSKLGAAAIKDGTAIKDPLGNLITLPSAQLDSRVQIYHTTYTGTGTDGSSNPKSIAMPAKPTLVMIIPRGTGQWGLFNVEWLTSSYQSYGYIMLDDIASADSHEYAKYTSLTLSWYSTRGSGPQLNNTIVYDVFAFSR